MAYVTGSSAGRGRARPDGPGSDRAGAPERTSLSARARDAVRERIVDRRYPQGARLVEREVAEELRMSRVPVREALRALVGEGLLELLPHSGVRVRRMERADVEHLYEVWEPLAVQASRLAARRVARSAPAEPPGVTALRISLDRAEQAASDDEGAREVAAHTAFHEDIVALSGNPMLARTLEQLSGQLQLLFGMREEPEHMRAQHAVMFRYIATGDEESAAASTLLHVRDSRAVALRSLFDDA
ncbi:MULTISPECIES: GntR family transcriptional regulator [unclassified Streptomyces]|uniref:GntR family transcriptional regulator n=1 Tax=unclassified Streptomyces TaxID=2593676 RepID=UPI001BE6F533|nr:GntR family transcriptional regulator [Streptomyces sp. McG3]MBT2901870.1 GntR family transcriptional regulator [Streptomyces sp. McG3]